MKAAFIERYGGPEVFQYGEFHDPVAGSGEVVVDIVAASVNAADWKVRLGEYKHTKLPLIPGRDFSGVVSAISENAKDIALAMRSSASAKLVRRGPTRRKSPSRLRLSPRSRAIYPMTMLPRSRSLASRL
jgi:NADPH:quinone reductase-like Zn-dependent oxidoreductase